MKEWPIEAIRVATDIFRQAEGGYANSISPTPPGENRLVNK